MMQAIFNEKLLSHLIILNFFFCLNTAWHLAADDNLLFNLSDCIVGLQCFTDYIHSIKIHINMQMHVTLMKKTKAVVLLLLLQLIDLFSQFL